MKLYPFIAAVDCCLGDPAPDGRLRQLHLPRDLAHTLAAGPAELDDICLERIRELALGSLPVCCHLDILPGVLPLIVDVRQIGSSPPGLVAAWRNRPYRAV